MALTFFSTVFEVGFHPREISTVPARPAGSTGAPPAAPAFSEPKDIVETSHGQNGAGSGNTFFEQAPEKFGLAGTRTRYAIDLDSNEVVIKVIDPESQKELRQIPTEEHRDLARRIREYQDIAFER